MPQPPQFNESTLLASFESYEDAERTVDRLAEQGFPVEHVTIVGHGLRYREQVVGRETLGTALAAGAAQGAVVGAFFAVVFGLFGAIDNVWAFAWLELGGLVYGGLAGLAIAAIAYALRHRRRDRNFFSERSLAAERYDVHVGEGRVQKAAALLNLEGHAGEARGSR
jgi:hypothetical protein